VTKPTIAELQNWLEQDEAGSRSYRAERLAKLLAVIPEEEMVFFGGLASAQAYTEIRLSYIHGLYLSTVLLALACIEQDACWRSPYSRHGQCSEREAGDASKRGPDQGHYHDRGAPDV